MSDEKIIYLVFTDSSSYWLARWLRPGYRHVFAFSHHEGNWALVDPALNSLSILLLEDAKGLDLIEHYARQNPKAHILHVGIMPNPDMPVYRIGPISCVSTIQYLLGVYWPLTLTPWQLYSKLLRKTPPHIRIIDDGRKQQSRESSQESS